MATAKRQTRDIRTKTIRIAPGTEKLLWEPNDWLANVRRPVMYHRPTRTYFWIKLPARAEFEPIAMTQVLTRFYDIDAGCKMPSESELMELGKMAIVAFVRYIESLPPKEGEPNDTRSFTSEDRTLF